MLSTKCFVRLAAAALTTVAGSFGIHAQQSPEWPQFLGPDRNGNARVAIAPTATLALAWKVEAPSGRSGLTVSGNRIYTMGSDGDRQLLVALDTASGTEVWRTSLGDVHANDPMSTPAIVGSTVVTMTESCVVHGVDASTGKAVWQRSLVADFKSRLAARGCNMSPLIDGSTVVVPTASAAGGTMVVALNATTGEPAWTAGNLPVSLSTPVGVGQFGGERLILYHHAKPPGTSGLTALRRTTSGVEVAWQIDLPEGISDTTALALPDNKVLLQTWASSSLISAPNAQGAAPAISWSTTDLWALYSPPVHHEGALYGWGGNSTEFFSAVDVATGKTRWTERIYRGYIVNAGGTLVVLSEASGLLRLVAADPTRYRELTRLTVFRPGARTVTPPTVVGGRIYVRNLEEIVAINAINR